MHAGPVCALAYPALDGPEALRARLVRAKKKARHPWGRRALAGIPGRAFSASGRSEHCPRPCWLPRNQHWPEIAGPLILRRSLVDVSKEPNATKHYPIASEMFCVGSRAVCRGKPRLESPMLNAEANHEFPGVISR